MPGPLVHAGALLTCPHQGAVTVVPSNTRVLLGGMPAVNALDVHTIIGCTFTVANKPQPCVTVRLEASKRVLIAGQPAVILTPLAQCYSAENVPQGPPNAGGIQHRVMER